MRAALALVPDQPTAGRLRLPEASPELAVALAGHPWDVIARAFPSLVPALVPALSEPWEEEWHAAASALPVPRARVPGTGGRAPSAAAD